MIHSNERINDSFVRPRPEAFFVPQYAVRLLMSSTVIAQIDPRD